MLIQQGPSFKVIIIGSGLAGSLLANGLVHHDVDVRVFERLERHAKREGYQIRLGNGALTGMRACLTKTQIEDITAKFGRAGGLRSGAPIIRNKHFHTLLDLSIFPTYNKSAPISRGVLRDSLADPVFEAGRLEYGKKFSRYEILNAGTATERVRAWFDDGSCDDCDLLIGADGSHSKINKQLGLDNISQIKTHNSFICKNELPTSHFMKMDPQVRGKPVMTFADRKAMFFCAYLPDKIVPTEPDAPKQVDENLSSSMFGCQIPVDECPDDLFERNEEEKWEFLSGQFREWAPEYLVKGTELYVSQPRASARPTIDWRKKVQAGGVIEYGHPRVWLLGDAMHAMLPLRGMGGNQSLWDAATVLPLVSTMSKSTKEGNCVMTEEISEALNQYEAEMIPRAFEWVEKSGGQTIMSADTATWQGVIHFKVLAFVMNLEYIWLRIMSLFRKQAYVDDVPELRD